MRPEELELRRAIADLVAGREDGPITDPKRELFVTTYPGAYGPAGAVLTIEGSPPVALVLVTLDKSRYHATVVVFKQPGNAKRPVVIGSWKARSYRSGKKKRVWEAATAYLAAIGVGSEGLRTKTAGEILNTDYDEG